MNENYLKDLFIDEVKGSLKGGSGGSTGAGLPSGGTDGQVLTRDSNGKAVWKDIPAGDGGVTSWNDLGDKPFGEEFGVKTIYESTFDTTNSNEENEIFVELDNFPTISPDGHYTVEYNGTVYELQSFVDEFESDYVFLGATPWQPTEELPFVIGYSTYNFKTFICVNSKMIHVIKVNWEGTIIHTLDTKYLPEYIYREIPEQRYCLFDGIIETSVSGGEPPAQYWFTEDCTIDSPILEEGVYEIIYDGVTYSNISVRIDYGYRYLEANGISAWDEGSICSLVHRYDYTDQVTFYANSEGSHSFKVYHIEPAKPIPIEPKFIPKSSRSDWNDSDVSSINYINNRPFYEEFILGDPVYCDIVDMTTYSDRYSGDYGYYYVSNNIGFAEPLNIEVGRKYSVKLDGVRYILTATTSPTHSGAIDIIARYDNNNIEPNYEKGDAPVAFRYFPSGACGFFYFAELSNHEVEICVVEDSVVHKIESKFLPMDDIAAAVLDKLPTWTGGSY